MTLTKHVAQATHNIISDFLTTIHHAKVIIINPPHPIPTHLPPSPPPPLNSSPNYAAHRLRRRQSSPLTPSPNLIIITSSPSSPNTPTARRRRRRRRLSPPLNSSPNYAAPTAAASHHLLHPHPTTLPCPPTAASKRWRNKNEHPRTNGSSPWLTLMDVSTN